jgi:hypothetical protein
MRVKVRDRCKFTFGATIMSDGVLHVSGVSAEQEAWIEASIHEAVAGVAVSVTPDGGVMVNGELVESVEQTKVALGVLEQTRKAWGALP